MGTPLAEHVVQVHLTTRCNLRCAHCYSASGPDRADELDLRVVLAALERLRGEGYSQLSLSGGEPTLYKDLPELLAQAKQLGWRTSVVTNGLTVASRRFEQSAPSMDVVAVSLDGGEATHDRLRGRDGSFRKALENLAALKTMVPVVAVATCVTRDVLAELPELHALLGSIGVDVMQLRPLAKVGRAAEMDTGTTGLSSADTIRLAALTAYLDRAPGGPRVRCEQVRRDHLPAAIETFTILQPQPDRLPFSALVNPLVIDERGDVYPFAYGLPRRYSLGNVCSLSTEELHRARSLALLPDLIRATATLAQASDCPPFVDWYSLLLLAAVPVQSPVSVRR